MTVLKFLPYVRKNVLGHRVRSAMTVLGTALLLFLFLFVNSIQNYPFMTFPRCNSW